MTVIFTLFVCQHTCYCDKQKENVVIAFSTYLQCHQSYNYFRFWRSCCYFRLSVVVAIIWEHSFELAVVEKLHFVSTVTQYLFWIWFIILVNVTTKFRQCKKIPHVFDVTANNFRCTDWRSCYFILYPLHTQEKLRKSGAICQTGIMLWFINFDWGLYSFFTPKRTTGIVVIIYGRNGGILLLSQVDFWSYFLLSRK